MTQENPKCSNTNEQKDGTAFSSPSMGLNNNLEFMGKQLHVQTEHMGFPVAHIVTQVFCGGRVLLSKKSEYPSNAQEPQDLSKVQQLMHAQHCQIIQEITSKKNRILGSH